MLIEELAGPRRNSRPPGMELRLDRLCGKRRRAGAPLFPDEIDVLRFICREIDDEANASLAWQKVCDISQTRLDSQMAELPHVHSAIAANIHDCTTAYFQIGTNPLEVATGMFVGIGARVFLVTTAHSIPVKPNGKLSFVGMSSANVDENIPVIADFACDTDEAIRDVAFLEIDPAFVPKLKKRPLPLSRIYPCGPGESNSLTVVSGYPSQIVQKTRESTAPRPCSTIPAMAGRSV